MKNKKVLVTGMAGFIGHHLTKLLVQSGYDVVGLDNINNYYDPNLKLARLTDLGFDTAEIEYNKLLVIDQISFVKLDLTDLENIKELFKTQQFNYVVNLAAQAGVRYSLKNPHSYVDSNITGFLNILESCRAYPVEHLIFASSSSVYGLSEEIPFQEDNCTDHPLAIYAASKKANEMMAHSYANLYQIPCTGLRFFTVYGPWGRPDMALHLFTEAMVNDREFEVFNNGDMSRDFTYVADIVESIKRLIPLAPKENNPDFNPKKPTPSKSSKAYQIFNIGNNSPVALMDFVKAVEKALGKKGKVIFKPMQPGDVQSTYANVESLFEYINFKPTTNLEEGVKAFVTKYLELESLKNK
ncbi:NAD-dependent epimerase/dehydratase family protein [Lutibacter sp. HS1-25]|uniref:NAD-dependent epimerase/dehydratase family protein n=1 Tax=Lutibacter sp. HS1-25 TaxID=2485000 RepID=UPI0010128F10|nr:NAD-dependent epimerase/dehydratase family protein [Lutibacter sp. HS1-25]RXP57057.1 NAD-dependent epimerase/dehydratase family protein [Lutibacter sp. HS1-25]